MTDYVFLDTETLGLDPAAPMWEFAAIRRDADDTGNSFEDTTHFFIRHNRGDWLDQLPEQFQQDYATRFNVHDALDERSAAIMIHIVTRGAELVICNPVFDEPRLAAFLRSHGIEPEWHYHPWDIASVALGYICGRDSVPPPLPWKSDQLSREIGVDPGKFARHTALGDVRWTLAQWDLINGGHR
ncbi:hypothetical protein [Mycolicibacterium porcinum]